METWERFTYVIWICLVGFGFETRFKMMRKIADFAMDLLRQEHAAVQNPAPAVQILDAMQEIDAMRKNEFEQRSFEAWVEAERKDGCMLKHKEKNKTEADDEEPEAEGKDEQLEAIFRELLGEEDPEPEPEIGEAQVAVYGPQNAANDLERKYGNLDDKNVQDRMRRTFWQNVNSSGQGDVDNVKRRRISQFYKDGDED